MEPTFVNKPAFTVAGMMAHNKGMEEKADISALWTEFWGRHGEIKSIVNENVTYGVMANYDESTKAWDYLAGLEVSNSAALPEGMVSLTIPAGKYAIFPCTLPTIEKVYNYIYQEWLPKSGHQHAAQPEFELYPETFQPQNPESEFQVYVPLQ